MLKWNIIRKFYALYRCFFFFFLLLLSNFSSAKNVLCSYLYDYFRPKRNTTESKKKQRKIKQCTKAQRFPAKMVFKTKKICSKNLTWPMVKPHSVLRYAQNQNLRPFSRSDQHFIYFIPTVNLLASKKLSIQMVNTILKLGTLTWSLY